MPIGREKSGVHRYCVLRSVDDPNYVMVDLEFDSANEAAAVRAALLELWGRVQEEGLIGAPQARLVDAVETREL